MKTFLQSIDFSFIFHHEGPGCGGELYNYGGSFSSPGYPNTEQNSSDCTWTVSVPMNLYVAINFNGKIDLRSNHIQILIDLIIFLGSFL